MSETEFRRKQADHRSVTLSLTRCCSCDMVSLTPHFHRDQLHDSTIKHQTKAAWLSKGFCFLPFPIVKRHLYNVCKNKIKGNFTFYRTRVFVFTFDSAVWSQKGAKAQKHTSEKHASYTHGYSHGYLCERVRMMTLCVIYKMYFKGSESELDTIVSARFVCSYGLKTAWHVTYKRTPFPPVLKPNLPRFHQT